MRTFSDAFLSFAEVETMADTDTSELPKNCYSETGDLIQNFDLFIPFHISF